MSRYGQLNYNGGRFSYFFDNQPEFSRASGSGSMSLNRLFWLISIALMLLFSALAARIVAIEWGAYLRGVRSIDAVNVVQLTMISMEKMSLERAPSNVLMGSEHAALPELRQHLELA